MIKFLVQWPYVLAEMAGSREAALWQESPHALLIVAIYLLMMLAGVGIDTVGGLYVLTRPVGWRAFTERFRRLPWRLRDASPILLALITLYIWTLVGIWLTRALWESTLFEQTSNAMILQSVVFHWAALVMIVLLVRRRGWRWSRAFSLQQISWLGASWRGALVYLGALPLIAFYSLLFQFLLRWAGYEQTLQDVALAVTDQQALPVQVYLFFVAVVLAPVAEELLFRGVVLPAVAERLGFLPAAVLVSLLFAAIHMHLFSFVALFTIAMAFSFAYFATGSLRVSICMHMVFNGVNLGLLFLLRNGG